MKNSFDCLLIFDVGGCSYQIVKMIWFESQGYNIVCLFFVLCILFENFLWCEDDQVVLVIDIEVLFGWDVKVELNIEIVFMLVCVLLQDFMGVFVVVDLVVMCDVMSLMGGNFEKINLLQLVEFVIDYLVQVDEYGMVVVFLFNVECEFECNEECYYFFCWGQNVFENFCVVLLVIGIVYQVNFEYFV